ncbi:MAG: PSD1 and planctomycete cytochrome C domain-containing protein [Bryobacterales bacterium]|nr:PSD1 and planctomycete cytochrome C domain-containing protein [Bryobacterales bacterium]MDE0292787.1 PSD1 and planctomycete cytochrome C domain-containing protein [Bryobacterales bacterium]
MNSSNLVHMRRGGKLGTPGTVVLLTGLVLGPSAGLLAGSEPEEFFETKIRPLFAAQCQSCHDDKQKLGGLDLTRREGLDREGSGGPVIVPGDAGASALIRAVRYESKIKMPPTGKLSATEIVDLTEWVRMGAPWPGVRTARRTDTAGGAFTEEEKSWWSFQPVLRQEPPAVRNADWVSTPIDNFILARLESESFEPAPAADKLTLLRRVTYDLTGLPPTEREIKDYLADDSADAYETVVERLLDSSRYGERWGRHWLDVARYADSTGVDEDHKYPFAWKYRDYVVDAFNDGIPFDRFLQEQIAGDLFPAEEPGTVNARGIIATGFLALGPKLIAEQDKKKMLYDMIDEQIEVVGKAVLGLTLQCARCHDHKFDPIRQRDYYSMASIFRSTRQVEDWRAHVSELYFMPLVPEAESDQYFSHQKKIKLRDQQIKNIIEEQSAAYVMRVLPGVPKFLIAAREVKDAPPAPVPTTAASAETAAEPDRDEALIRVASKHELDVDRLRKWIEYLKPTDEVRPHLNRLLEAGATELPAVAEHYRAEFKKTASKRYADLAAWRIEFDEALANGEEPPERPRFFGGENRFFTETTTSKGPLGISREQRKKVFSGDAFERLTQLEADLRELKQTLPPKPPMANAVTEEDPYQQRIFVGGNVHVPGEAVPKAFPAVLTHGKQPEITGISGRMELARWLSSPDNPLTVRVIANRIWQWHFGEGLVRTPNNFGRLGASPTHPELLDYLASEFVNRGWSFKAMHRLIVFSSAYRMSTETTARAREKDPDNRLWSHFNRRRMDVEEIRDSLLAIEGTIDFGMGGTLQSGEGQGMTTTNQLPHFDASKSYRRTLYLPLRRANIPKLLTLFDFADAATSTGSRSSTNVAPQALFMMNSEYVSRVAEGFARRVLAERRTPDEQRVRQAWHMALAKEPTVPEIEEALDYIRAFRKQSLDKDLTEVTSKRMEGPHRSPDYPAYHYSASMLAAWQSYCRVLLASNDFIYIQ